MFQEEIEKLHHLANCLKQTRDLAERQEILLANSRVQEAINQNSLTPFLRSCSALSSKNALFAVAAINQHRTVLAYPKPMIPREKIRALLTLLTQLDKFYESIGGIVGYQLLVLKMLAEDISDATIPFFSKAPHIDVEAEQNANEFVLAGLTALSEMGEIYPIGGLGSRLNLVSKNGEPLPAAMLLFGGRTLLEGLIRDLQAKEFCYFRLFGKQITVPIAMMTSKEKQNDARVYSLCEKKKWFGRPKESFFLFSQASVPVVAKNGQWALKAPLELNLQPGGHGALWRTAEEKGVFRWFMEQEKHRLLVRQINNPIAGLDNGLFVLMGAGKVKNKAFGFASCERLSNAAEGALALVEEEGMCRISNIEYTDFRKFGVEKRLSQEGFPANTNILYADLYQLLPHIKKNPLPGLVFNMKSKITVMNQEGKSEEMLGGRLESMMQNISDSLLAEKTSLPTFLTFNRRRKTISATKRSYENDLLETPEGAFYDLYCNAYELLSKSCGVHLPPLASAEEYMQKGPSFLFLYHPALGPLYQIICQKILGGNFSAKSELQLEIADVILQNLELDGSLLIQADNLMGISQQGIVRYSQKTGKCILKNVKVKNKGRQEDSTLSTFWKNAIKRVESFKIVLLGHSEFYAQDVTFEGGQIIVVPPNERWVVRQKPGGEITIEKSLPCWNFLYNLDNKTVKLSVLEERTCRKLF